MLTDQLKELQAAKDKAAELEVKIAAERRQALTGLPAQFGFTDMAEFVRALPETGGRKRTRITEAQRAEVKRLLTAGQTGAQIAAATGLSLPSIQTIKKSPGPVKARNKGGNDK